MYPLTGPAAIPTLRIETTLSHNYVNFCFSDDGRKCVAVHTTPRLVDSFNLIFFDCDPFQISNFTAQATTCIISPDGNRISSSMNETVRAWIANSQRDNIIVPPYQITSQVYTINPVAYTTINSGKHVLCSAFSPDSSLLAVWYEGDGFRSQNRSILEIFDTTQANKPRELKKFDVLKSYQYPDFRLSFSPDSNKIAVITDEQSNVIIYDLGTSRPITTVRLPIVGYLHCYSIALCDDHSLVYARHNFIGATSAQGVKCWELPVNHSINLSSLKRPSLKIKGRLILFSFEPVQDSRSHTLLVNRITGRVLHVIHSLENAHFTTTNQIVGIEQADRGIINIVYYPIPEEYVYLATND